jgi:hypothetical protein
MSFRDIESFDPNLARTLRIFAGAMQSSGGESAGGSFADLGTRLLYHATNEEAAGSILGHGAALTRAGHFRCGSSGCVGGGIYFADTPSAARHKSRNGSEIVLRVKVHLGNAFIIRNGVGRGDVDAVDRSGSVYLPNGAGGGDAEAEYAVFSTSKILEVVDLCNSDGKWYSASSEGHWGSD